MYYPYLIKMPDNKNVTILKEEDFLDLAKQYMGESSFKYLEQYMLETKDWYNKLIKINQVFEDDVFDE